MRRAGRSNDLGGIAFTLTKAGCKEGPPVELTGAEFNELVAMNRGRKPKYGPKTKAQREASALFEEFVRRGMGR
jgi:hypothetical protein